MKHQIHNYILKCTFRSFVIPFLVMMFIFVQIDSGRSQSPIQEWIGTYTGYLVIYGAKLDSVKLDFKLTEFGKGTYQYLMKYTSPHYRDVVKDYKLVEDSLDTKLAWIDEGEGIMIKENLFDNCMLSYYTVDKLWMTTSLCFEGQKATFELKGGKIPFSTTTDQTQNEDVLKSFDTSFLQRAILVKVK